MNRQISTEKEATTRNEVTIRSVIMKTDRFVIEHMYQRVHGRWIKYGRIVHRIQ